MHGVIKHKDYEIEYFVFGNGPKVLFAFHGFNNHANDFEALSKVIGDRYRIVAVNLFFHGASYAHVGLVQKGFSVNDLKDLFNDLRVVFPAEKYTLMGYSLGGRIVMKLMEIIPEKIESIVLLAPDGIRISPFYKFITRTHVGKNIMEDLVKDPSLFFRFAKVLRKTRVVGEKKYQFALTNFDTEPKRKKVFLVWMILRKIVSENATIKEIVRKNNIRVYLFFGKNDRIIPPSIGIKYQKGMEKYISLHILDAGHRLMREAVLLEVGKRMVN